MIEFDTYLLTRYGMLQIDEVTRDNLKLLERSPIYVRGAIRLEVDGREVMKKVHEEYIAWLIPDMLRATKELDAGALRAVVYMPEEPEILELKRFRGDEMSFKFREHRDRKPEGIGAGSYKEFRAAFLLGSLRLYRRLEEVLPRGNWDQDIARFESLVKGT